MSRRPATPERSPLIRSGATLAATLLLLAGCTGGEPSEAPSPGATSAPPATLPTAPPTSAVAPLEPTEFAFQAPDPVCPPSSALETFPLADHRRYVSVDPFLGDQDEFRTICGYERAEIGDGEDMIVEDHAYVSVYTTLYRRWEDSANSRIQFWPEMPMGSDDLDDWERTATTRNDRDVRWEGCGPATQCGEGEEPTVRTHSSRWAFNGHVGNLDFDQVNVLYIAEEIPADVESRVVAIFRDVVLAVLDSYERVD